MGKKRSRDRGSRKRTFAQIRRKILFSLTSNQKNIREIAKSSGINWRTTRNHLIYLLGMKYIKEIVSTPQVRIFEITSKGAEALSKKWK